MLIGLCATVDPRTSQGIVRNFELRAIDPALRLLIFAATVLGEFWAGQEFATGCVYRVAGL